MKMIRKAAALILIATILMGCDAWEEDRKLIVDYRYTSEHYEKELEYNFEDIKRREVPALFSFTATTEKRYIICPVCKREIALKDRIVIGSEAADD